MTYEEVRPIITARLASLGRSQRELSRAVGTSSSNVRVLMTCKRGLTPQSETLFRVLDALGLEFRIYDTHFADHRNVMQFLVDILAYRKVSARQAFGPIRGQMFCRSHRLGTVSFANLDSYIKWLGLDWEVV